MKKIKLICSILLLLVVASSCKKQDGIDQDLSFLNNVSSSNPDKIFDISNDNSGIVKITPLGDGVAFFTVNFGEGTGTAASAVVIPGNNTRHAYREGSYTVSIITNDVAGKTSTATYPLTVTFRAPEKLLVTKTQAAHNLKVKATADFAASFLVYFGDVANEVGTALAKGAELSHDYATSGKFNVKVVALSGGAAKSENISVVIVTDPFGLPIDFDNAYISYFFGTFGGGQAFAKVANPSKTGLNTSDSVGRFTRGFEGWSGTYSPLNIPVNFAQGKKIKMLVFNPNAALIGKSVNVELEKPVGLPADPANPWGAVVKTPLTTSGAWEELTFDFSGIAAIPATAKFNQLVLRFNDQVDGAGAIIYIDNIRLTN